MADILPPINRVYLVESILRFILCVTVVLKETFLGEIKADSLRTIKNQTHALK